MIHWTALGVREGWWHWISVWPTWYQMMIGSMTYFTTWTLLANMLITAAGHPRMMRMCLVMNIQSSLGGFYICHVFPRRLRVEYASLELDGVVLVLADLLTHHVPTLWSVRRILPSVRLRDGDLWDTTPIVLYMLCFDLKKKYGLERPDLVYLGIMFMGIVATIY